MVINLVNPSGRSLIERAFNFKKSLLQEENVFSRAAVTPLKTIKENRVLSRVEESAVEHRLRKASVRDRQHLGKRCKLLNARPEMASVNAAVPTFIARSPRYQQQTEVSRAKRRGFYSPRNDALPRPRVQLSPLSARQQAVVDRLNGAHTASSRLKVR